MSVYTLKHSTFYAKTRPKPSKELISTVIDFLSEKLAPNEESKWNLSLDVGCGSGQCTQLLAPYFDAVIGSDAYANQIDQAKNNVNISNVSFVESPAEKLPASDGSVDLITCSQSMHWFNLDKFYTEVNRALKDNGAIAAFGYSNIPTVTMKGNDTAGKELTEHLRSTYEHKYITQYAIPKLKVVDRLYIDLDFPFDDFTRVDGIKTSVEGSVDDLEGYVQAWSDFHRCYSSEPETAKEVLEIFRSSVAKTLRDHNLGADHFVKMTFHNFLIMGRKKLI